MSDTHPTVSVIVPGYNHGAYLGEALRSLEAQSYGGWELLYVDDGSTDGSLEIARAFEERHPSRTRILCHDGGANRGIVATYQRGISEARGNYTAFLESDDLWSRSYLEEKVGAFGTFPQLTVVFSPCRILTDGWYGRDMALRQRVLQARLPVNEPFCNFRRVLRKNNVATFSAFVVRTSSVQALDVPQDPRLAFYDWWVLAHSALDGFFYFDTKSSTTWRHHTSSHLGSQSVIEHQDRLIGFYDLLYESIGARIECSDTETRRSFEIMQKAMPKFRAFYADPRPSTFASFFANSPAWAAEALISHWVNARKFGQRPRGWT